MNIGKIDIPGSQYLTKPGKLPDAVMANSRNAIRKLLMIFVLKTIFCVSKSDDSSGTAWTRRFRIPTGLTRQTDPFWCSCFFHRWCLGCYYHRRSPYKDAWPSMRCFNVYPIKPGKHLIRRYVDLFVTNYSQLKMAADFSLN